MIVKQPLMYCIDVIEIIFQVKNISDEHSNINLVFVNCFVRFMFDALCLTWHPGIDRSEVITKIPRFWYDFEYPFAWRHESHKQFSKAKENRMKPCGSR